MLPTLTTIVTKIVLALQRQICGMPRRPEIVNISKTITYNHVDTSHRVYISRLLALGMLHLHSIRPTPLRPVPQNNCCNRRIYARSQGVVRPATTSLRSVTVMTAGIVCFAPVSMNIPVLLTVHPSQPSSTAKPSQKLSARSSK